MDRAAEEPPGGSTRLQAGPPSEQSVRSKDPPLGFTNEDDDLEPGLQAGPPSEQSVRSKDPPPLLRDKYEDLGLRPIVDFEEKPKDLSFQLKTSNHLERVRSLLQQRYRQVFEGVATAGRPAPLQQIYTELYITEGGASEVNQEHEVRHFEAAFWSPNSGDRVTSCSDMFKERPSEGKVRTVLTKGEAGVGKTVLTQKVSLDWAEGRSHQNIQLLLPFTFRELSVLRYRSFSLDELIGHFFVETKGRPRPEQLLFILDGLDECRLPLDFSRTRVLTEPSERASVGELLVNLIRGDLLPSARLWITTRPAAANQIPAECVSMVTEVRGFTDEQKEQYFRRRFSDEQQASTVVSHIKKSRVLHSMCYNPMFCWILSTVLEDLLKESTSEHLPHTLTQMYVHFLLVQVKVKSLKYDGGSERDSPWTPENRKMVSSLDKLAFEQLQKGHLIFYEQDLMDCGLNAATASVYSGVFTEIFRQEPAQVLETLYCFIHLSVQEFLAALHLHQTFYRSGENLLTPPHSSQSPETFYRSAVDQALQSPTGRLDLLLRFLLGLSLPTNQRRLQGLLTQTGNAWTNQLTVQQTVQYIEGKIYECQSAERIVNLFYCLFELKDHSLVKKIQKNIREERLRPEDMSSALWMALTFLLLSSDLEDFDLKKYRPKEEMLLSLLRVVEASVKALLSECNLTERCCGPLSSMLSSESCALKVLDLSNNPIQDSGVEQLCVGLKSATCRLENVNFHSCSLTEESCRSLASVLNSLSSSLKDLNLSDNALKDTGLKYLSSALGKAHCKLTALQLDNCEITDEGVASLDSALKTGSPDLKEVGLAYNRLSHTEHLRSLKERVSSLSGTFQKVDYMKYYRRLTLDPNTAHRNLRVSELNRCAEHTGLIRYWLLPWRSSNPERFDSHYQVLCSEPLSGRCFWLVDWSGWVDIAVSYRGVQRKGETSDCEFGGNEQSWSIRIQDRYYAWHNNEVKTSWFYKLGWFYLDSRSNGFGSQRQELCQTQCDPGSSGQVAVFLDHGAGRLSFYHVSEEQLIHIHTFETTFTEPLYAAFGCRWTLRGSSVRLAKV